MNLTISQETGREKEATSRSFFGPEDLIYAYTRADAINDGTLVEVPLDLAQEAGIMVPVALTRSVWDRYISPAYLAVLPGQSTTGRLWDLLLMFTLAARRTRHTNRIDFQVAFVALRNQASEFLDDPVVDFETETFTAVCGPGDQGEPVITIMLPNED